MRSPLTTQISRALTPFHSSTPLNRPLKRISSCGVRASARGLRIICSGWCVWGYWANPSSVSQLVSVTLLCEAYRTGKATQTGFRLLQSMVFERSRQGAGGLGIREGCFMLCDSGLEFRNKWTQQVVFREK